MAGKNFIPRLAQIAVAFVLLLSCAAAWAGENIILSLDKTHGSYPLSTLASDASGNLYGTTSSGGRNGCGNVFELSLSGEKWTEKVLYSFKGCTQQTMTPRGGLIFDKMGNLFGVLQGFVNDGWVYELSPQADGTWSEAVIHTFNSVEGMPSQDLAWDSAGNLYGTTQNEFGKPDGEVFQLSPQTNGAWNETVLYTFPASNGLALPAGGPALDAKGNIYGMTWYGLKGSFGGAVYELSPQANGIWSLSVLSSGIEQQGYGTRLTFDPSGNLYGTMAANVNGAIFELSPTASGSWQEKTIHTFSSGTDGSQPQEPLIFDASGNLYGTTSAGGTGCNSSLCGTVYKLSPQDNGKWKETILHYFESATDGSEPAGGVILDSNGDLYGTTSHGGGRYGYGTIYKITP
jgi:uncharacterized repeat protein (TIGR03803 family)